MLYEYNHSFLERILNHFKTIQVLEVILSFKNYLGGYGYYKGMCNFMFNGLKTINPSSNTEFIPSPFVLNDPCEIPPDIKTSLNVIVHEHFATWYYINRIPSLTNLTVIISNSLLTIRRGNFRLHKLHIHHVRPRVFTYTISEVFDTSLLRELSLVGVVYPIDRIFCNHQLDEEYPRLIQLCVRHEGTSVEGCDIQVLKDYSHKGLSMLVVSSKISNEVIARTIRRFCFNFPKSSINWWYEPRRFVYGFLGENKCRVDSAFTHNINMLSLQLPFGIVGYHFPKIYDIRSVGYFYSGGIKKGKRQSFSFLKKCYTDLELEAIYEQFMNFETIR